MSNFGRQISVMHEAATMAGFTLKKRYGRTIAGLSLTGHDAEWALATQIRKAADATSGSYIIACTLSTANNSESDAQNSGRSGGNSILTAISTITKYRFMLLAAKTSFYLNSRTQSTNLDNIYNRGDQVKTFVSATCAYL